MNEAFGWLILKKRVASKKTKKLRELARAIDEMMEEQFPTDDETQFFRTPSVSDDMALSPSLLESLRNAIDFEMESRGVKALKRPGPIPGSVGRGLVGSHAEEMQEHDLGTLHEHGADTSYENKKPGTKVTEYTPGDAFETLPVPKGGRTKRKKREKGEYGRGQSGRGQRFYNPGEDTSPWVVSRLLDESLRGDHEGGIMMPNKVSGTRNYTYTSERAPYHPVSQERATTPEPQPPTPSDYEQPLEVTRQPRPGVVGVAESTPWKDRPDTRSLVRVRR